MPEQREQNDDWDWNTDQPQKYPSAETHDFLLFPDMRTTRVVTRLFHQRNLIVCPM
jgi:hypothetical protein